MPRMARLVTPDVPHQVTQRGVLVNRDSVRRSLGCLKGQVAGLPSDLVLAWSGTAHKEDGTTFFRSKISWRWGQERGQNMAAPGS